jgi:hypothetical protein
MAGAGLGVSDIFTIATGASLAVQPPSGETWIVTANVLQTSCSIEAYDGTLTFLINNGPAADDSMRYVFDNADYFRFVNGSGSVQTFWYSAVKVQLGFADIFSLAAATNQVVQPPSGETWMVMCTGLNTSSAAYAYDGTLTSLLQNAGAALSAHKWVFDNADYLWLKNESGATLTFYYGGVKV